MRRSSGVLLHITSLPGRYGIGALGKQARQFADFCRQAGLSWWQVLPVGPTGYGNSPYQSDSVFAGNPQLCGDVRQVLLNVYLKPTCALLVDFSVRELRFL